jgi:2-oxoisovalerate dehydrogenase E2 component (dihydrolipoyl transacylase)
MGLYAIKMPDIGEGIAEVEVVAWHVHPGDTVAEDQVIADVMTDKANVEIPSPVAGTVVALGGKPGELMSVGAELIRLEVADEGNLKPGAALPAGPAKALAVAAGIPPQRTEEENTALVQARAEKQAPQTPPASVRPRATASNPSRVPGEKPIASPAVRNRARERGVELQFVHGSGPAGRITSDDLDVYLATCGLQQSVSRSSYAARSGEEAIPVIGLRRKIAQKMQDSKRRIPHFSYVEEVDVTELEALRGALNGRYAASRGKLTLLPLLARALVVALADFPQMNARFDDDAGVVTRYGPVHLGMATQTDGGLMVPVLRNAETLDPWACAQEIARLADTARTGKASRDELTGSTITISSLGALGGIVTTPVINHPEVAIIGVNRIVERPVYRGGRLEARQLMNLSSSFDHRVVDGMDAARFIQAVRALLETPALLFVE